MDKHVKDLELKRLHAIFTQVSLETGIPEAKVKKAFYDMTHFVQDEVIQPTKCRRVRLFRLGTLVPVSSKLTDYIERNHPERELPGIQDVIENRKHKYETSSTGE